MNTIDIQQHSMNLIKAHTRRVNELFVSINTLVDFNTPTTLNDAVDAADKAEAVLNSLIHKLQATRAELKYAIDLAKRNQVG
jgi:hypothetical protein